MRADTKELAQVFSNNVQYEVPLFQRPYVWNEDEHWSPLWEDLLALISDDEQRPHFLGAVVFEQQKQPTAVVERRLVIDGQQRMTTLQLLLGAIRDAARSHGLDQTALLVNQWVENANFVIAKPSDRFKVLPTQADQQAFHGVLSSDGEIESRISEAHTFFRRSVEEWIAEQNDPASELRELATALGRRMMLVVIDLDDSDEAQVIFETLNARGTPLEAADLIKNALFKAAMAADLDVQRLHDDHWARFLDDYWREEVRQGRLIRSRIDVFATHYLTMKTGREVRSSQLFKDFRAWMQHQDTDAGGLIRDLDRFGGVFEQFDNGLGTAEERRFISGLRTMDTSTVYPYLLWLYAESGADQVQRLAAIKAIESFLVRRLVLRMTAKNYNRLFLSLLERVRSSNDVAAATREFLLAGTGDATRWPADKELETSLPQMKLYGNLRRDRIQMVLEGVNRHQHESDTFAEPIQITGDLTIEHLMPQKWEAHWPIGDDPADRDRRSQLIHSIGNLTLLTQALNSSVSNGTWATKREAVLQHSAIPLNRLLPELWDEDAIETRSAGIAKGIAGAWPRPTDSHD